MDNDFGELHLLGDNDIKEDPRDYTEAMSDIDSKRWQEAMKSEMNSMYQNGGKAANESRCEKEGTVQKGERKVAAKRQRERLKTAQGNRCSGRSIQKLPAEQ